MTIAQGVENLPRRKCFAILIEKPTFGTWTIEVFEDREEWQKRINYIEAHGNTFRAVEIQPFDFEVKVSTYLLDEPKILFG
jgi:hypothetical protein